MLVSCSAFDPGTGARPMAPANHPQRRRRATMASMFHARSRTLQDRFDTRRIADRIEARLVKDEIDDAGRQLIESVDMFFLATADQEGRPSCSYKGGDPGFVRVVDAQTIAFPSYDGNGMYLSLGNVGLNPQVGLLFIDFERGSRLRLNGTASIDDDDSLLSAYAEAQLIVRVRVREVFPNCSRYIHEMKRVERSAFVPRGGCETPVPAWKRSEWARDAISDQDPARNPAKPTK
jgi:predicted pyridoxine 5'-phosphate oxidase superfamily flavin-nucleotide-binding protein